MERLIVFFTTLLRPKLSSQYVSRSAFAGRYYTICLDHSGINNTRFLIDPGSRQIQDRIEVDRQGGYKRG